MFKSTTVNLDFYHYKFNKIITSAILVVTQMTFPIFSASVGLQLSHKKSNYLPGLMLLKLSFHCQFIDDLKKEERKQTRRIATQFINGYAICTLKYQLHFGYGRKITHIYIHMHINAYIP